MKDLTITMTVGHLCKALIFNVHCIGAWHIEFFHGIFTFEWVLELEIGMPHSECEMKNC